MVAAIVVLYFGAIACATGPRAAAPPGPTTSLPNPSTASANPANASTPEPRQSTSGGVHAIGTATITRTGGLAGVSQLLVIAPDGAWVFTDKRSGASQQGRLTSSDRQSLTELFTNPALAQEAKRTSGPGTCSDGFVYTIRLSDVYVYYDQCMSGTSRPLTEQIIALVSATTPM